MMTTENAPAPAAPVPAPAAETPAPEPAAAPAAEVQGEEPNDFDLFAAAVKAAEGSEDLTAEPPAHVEPPTEPEPEAKPEAKPEKPEAKPEKQEAKEPEEKQEEAKANEPEDDGIPTMADLVAEQKRRREQQGNPSPAQPPQPEPPPAQPPGKSIDLEELRKNPVAALAAQGLNPRDVIRQLTASAFGGEQPKGEAGADTPALTMEDVNRLVQEQIGAYQRQVQEEQAAQQVRAYEQRFVEMAGDAERYPAWARLEPDERLYFGNKIAAQYQAAGQRPTLEQIAGTGEKYLAERFGPVGSPGPTAKTELAAGDEKPKTAPSPEVSTTLSQSLPAQPAGTLGDDPTDEELFAAAIRAVEAGG